ncbi:MAG TPA: hypothetical protein VIM38_04205 [Alphaproteobacteria bacterium]
MHTVESARQRPPWAALCALLFALAACLGACTASDAPRDIRGKVVAPGVWQDIAPADSRLNVDVVLGRRIAVYQRQIRHNAALHYRIAFDDGNGVIEIQYLPSRLYDSAAFDSMRSPGDFRAWAAKIMLVADGEIAAPAALFSDTLRRPRYGFYARAKDCLAARAGYYLGKVQDSVPREAYNAIVEFRYCGDRADIAQFRRLFDELAVR